MNMKPSPNFLVIGAMKSGSSSLYEFLNQHPDIFMSYPKEPEFFANDKNYSKGFEFYEKFFSGYQGQKRIGEASTSYSNYIGLEKTIKRIHQFNKNMKLIYIIRNPIARAYSAYFWRVRQLYEKLKFEQALDLEEKRKNNALLDAFSYKRMGLYFQIISKYLEFFDLENLHVVLLDDLINSQEETCNGVFEFLNIEKFQVTPIEKKQQNPSGYSKNKFIQKIIGQPNKLRNSVEFVMNHTVGEKTKHRIYHSVIDRNIQEFTYPPMKESTFDYLSDYYKEDIQNLEKFLNRDLSNWRNSKKKLCVSKE